MELDGISALITGGASGLGEATARHLSSLGATITIADLQDDKGEAVAADIGATYVNTDVTDTAVTTVLAGAGVTGHVWQIAQTAVVHLHIAKVGADIMSRRHIGGVFLFTPTHAGVEAAEGAGGGQA